MECPDGTLVLLKHLNFTTYTPDFRTFTDDLYLSVDYGVSGDDLFTCAYQVNGEMSPLSLNLKRVHVRYFNKRQRRTYRPKMVWVEIRYSHFFCVVALYTKEVSCTSIRTLTSILAFIDVSFTERRHKTNHRLFVCLFFVWVL